LAHYFTTGIEILRDTRKRITHFIACLGTSGTFVGTAKRLREELSSIQTIAVQPDSPFHGIEGVKHMESAMVPGIYDPNVIDETISVSTDEAQQMTLRLAREEGILVGVSSGAAVAASIKLAESIEEGYIVTILPDRGERYLTDNFWR
jgi:cysteine synthase B